MLPVDICAARSGTWRRGRGQCGSVCVEDNATYVSSRALIGALSAFSLVLTDLTLDSRKSVFAYSLHVS